MKILVCYDGSTYSAKALEFMSKICLEKSRSKKKHDVTILYVDKKDVKQEYYRDRIDEELKRFREVAHKDWIDPASEILEKGKKILSRHGIEAATKVREGDPAHEIVAEAREGYDLLIIGSHGSGGMSILLGNTFSSVAKTSPIPILIVKHVEE